MTLSFLSPLRAAVLSACLLAAPLAIAQQSYSSAQAASEAFVDALRRNDHNAMRTVLGADWKRFIPTGGVERKQVDAFLAAWDKGHHSYTEEAGSAMLSVGQPGWTLPIPIVKGKSGWKFDVRAGADLIRTARIGRNELAAMQATLAYFDAQREYATQDRTGGGVREYAQKFFSSKGKKDGLYWESALGLDQSPLGPLFAADRPKGPGYFGYRYKILKAQGKDAPGGAYDYMIGKRMRSGFALIAWPVTYGETGVTSFMVSHAGTVYEKDLGPTTDAVARAMTRFNPDSTWAKSDVPN
jgi:hypothetical protein